MTRPSHRIFCSLLLFLTGRCFVQSFTNTRLVPRWQVSTDVMIQCGSLSSKGDNVEVEDQPEAPEDASTDGAPTPPTTTTFSRPPPPSADMTPAQMMRALDTSPRRIFLSTLSATGIALAGNLFGVTSNLLNALPEETVEASLLDTYFPRGDYKRVRSSGYTYVVPKEWVADTTLELAKAQRRVKDLDYAVAKPAPRVDTLPDTAYGPPGRLNQVNTNVSVIRSTLMPGFVLASMGAPEEAADTFLSTFIAPANSGRKASLIRATDSDNRQTYRIEYTLDRGNNKELLRAIAVIATQPKDILVTLTVVAPESEWANKDEAAKLYRVAESFHLYG